ncbi:hypothetical protein YOLOSWAG_308 [Erwinia phage vB_EamM_Yoloswag]|uniref:Uncharacterized protein n=1 Tax=Erwinia phage vB_EamM_Yoloswag TaxID=1958956 RepID=A0A1S6L3M5_9CAUD|nr:hypothetical protein HOR66_gp308 [Erwinia phage vB_EamM_Yoloswag]AQT28778.1 hypothetical protein YOLOSWAG_308 [Erwinia phage vB_EamM_Yoloswag]
MNTTHKFDDESNTAISLAVEAAQKLIGDLNMQSIDVAITGARVYLTVADMLGGHLQQASFIFNGQLVTVVINVKQADDAEEFVSNEIDRNFQMELGDLLIGTMDEAVDEGVISGYEQGAMFIAALSLMYIGLKNSGITELRFRHSKKNYVSHITLMPEETESK